MRFAKARAAGDRQTRHRPDRRQSLATETERADIEEVVVEGNRVAHAGMVVRQVDRDLAVVTGRLGPLPRSTSLGRHLGVPTGSRPAEEFGFLGTILSVDQPSSAAYTRELLGWQPTEAGLLEDLDAGHYFTARP